MFECFAGRIVPELSEHGVHLRSWEALSPAKRVQVRRMAMAYLAQADRAYAPLLRFDAIAVVIDPHGRLSRLDHLEDAF